VIVAGQRIEDAESGAGGWFAGGVIARCFGGLAVTIVNANFVRMDWLKKTPDIGALVRHRSKTARGTFAYSYTDPSVKWTVSSCDAAV
jgi:hypothetical protein